MPSTDIGFTLRPTNISGETREDDWEVRYNGETIGRIYRTKWHPTDIQWFWTITAVFAPAAGFIQKARTATLDEAKAEVKANWNKWLAWAKLQAGD